MSPVTRLMRERGMSKPTDMYGREHEMDSRGWPPGTEKWAESESSLGPGRTQPHKVYAFNPPTDSSPPSHTGRIGLGSYYANLGMRKSDVDRRLRAQNTTGRDYLEVHASYNVHKKKD